MVAGGLPVIDFLKDLRAHSPASYAHLRDRWAPDFVSLCAPSKLTLGQVASSARHDPGRVTRRYTFIRPAEERVAVEVTFTLCFDGWPDVRDVAIRTVASHQGRLLRAASLSAEARHIGEIGIAWGYHDPASIDAFVFARHNVVVYLRRFGGDVNVPGWAIDLDRQLREAPSCSAYEAGRTGAFNAVGERPVILKAAGRLDLATDPDDGLRFYFASAGSVNRDPQSPRRRYYRAPSAQSSVSIWAYVLNDGIVAQREQLAVEVSS